MLELLLDLGFDPDERERIDNVQEVVRSAGRPLWTAARSANPLYRRDALQRGADPNVHVDAGDFPDKRALLCGIGGAPFTSPCGAHRKSAKIPVSGLGLFQNLMVVEGDGPAQKCL